MQTGFLLRDEPPPPGSMLRPNTWHVSALLASGYKVAVHETKHDATGRVWRTWRASEWPVMQSPDPDIARGAAHCVAQVNNGKMRALRPFAPYLTAYLAAKNLDTLAEWQRKGGVDWHSQAISGGVSPLAEVVSSVGSQDLAQSVLGGAVKAHITHPILAAAMVTLGFPLAGLTPAGVVQVLGISAGGDQSAAESLLCEGLSFAVAQQAALALDAVTEAQRGRSALADDAAVQQAGSLPGGHLFNWAYLGALRRHSLRPLEETMGHDSSKLRSHVLQPKRGKRHVDDGLAVVCTADEYRHNEAYILSHLRGR